MPTNGRDRLMSVRRSMPGDVPNNYYRESSRFANLQVWKVIRPRQTIGLTVFASLGDCQKVNGISGD
jgi:hypothetical protein